MLDIENRIAEAFIAVPRHNFVPAHLQGEAGIDRSLPIGYGQTISQPSTVREMLQWLAPEKGQKVLDVGSGSGWTTGLLSYLVGPNGKVIAVERVPELLKFGKKNCKRMKIKNATFHRAAEDIGWPDEAPYDQILVSAAASEMPEGLLGQLSVQGRLVMPIRNSIFVVQKGENGAIKSEEHRGYAFVPLVG